MSKGLRLTRGSNTLADLQGTWTYDTEGRVTQILYPNAANVASGQQPTYNYTYDAMGRLSTLYTQFQSLVSATTYNAATQLTQVTGTFRFRVNSESTIASGSSSSLPKVRR